MKKYFYLDKHGKKEAFCTSDKSHLVLRVSIERVKKIGEHAMPEIGFITNMTFRSNIAYGRAFEAGWIKRIKKAEFEKMMRKTYKEIQKRYKKVLK